MDNIIRNNLYLKSETHKELRRILIDKDKNIQQLYVELINKFIEEEKKKNKKGSK